MLTSEQQKRVSPIADVLGDVWLINPSIAGDKRLYENSCVLSLAPPGIHVTPEGGGVVIWELNNGAAAAICNCAGGTDIHHGDM